MIASAMLHHITWSKTNIKQAIKQGERVAEWLTSLGSSMRSRVRILVPPKVMCSDGIICKYLPLLVYSVFSMLDVFVVFVCID